MFAGDAELDLGFTGHREQEAHGLIDMRGRHYDPHLGRFASADPILAAPYSSQGHDPFAYVFNSPLRFVDPTGFEAEAEYEPPDYGDDDGPGYDGIPGEIDYHSDDLNLPGGGGFDGLHVDGLGLPDSSDEPGNESWPGWLDELDDYEPAEVEPDGDGWGVDPGDVVAAAAAAGIAVAGGLALEGIKDAVGAKALDQLGDEVGVSLRSIASGNGWDISRLNLFREIVAGEDLNELIEELAQRTYDTGREHGLSPSGPVSRDLHRRPDGIRLDFDFSRLLAHTHPVQPMGEYGPAPSRPSFLRESETQSSSWLIELFEDGTYTIGKLTGFNHGPGNE